MRDLGSISFDKAHQNWVISATPDVVLRLKRIFPRMEQSRASEIRLRHTAEIANELEWVLHRFPLRVDALPFLKREARSYRKMIERLEEIESATTGRMLFPLAVPLRSYQGMPVELLLEQSHLLNGDHIGLGKTATAIAACCDQRFLPALIVVQAHLPTQWRDEFARFLPGAQVHIIKSRLRYDLPPADVYISSYSKLDAWADILAEKVKSVSFDEVQELRHKGTAKYAAAKLIADKTAFRYGLSATPIYNYGGEIWSIYNILAPGALGNEEEFVREWCSVENGKTIVTDPEALGHYLRNTKLMVRRTRKDVGRELPKVTRIAQSIGIDKNVYETVIGGSAEELARTILSGTFLERGQAAREFDLRLRQATGLAKAPYVADLVRMLLESGEKVLLGGWHHSVYDVWRKRLSDYSPVFFTGEESPAEKQKAKEDFISGRSPLMIMSLRSGAGTDGLQRVCSCAVIGELDWSPKVLDQFIGRIDRDGQETGCTVYIPISEEGSDPTVASILGLKSAQSSGIVDLGADSDASILETSPERVRQLAIDFLKSRGNAVPEQATLDMAAAS